jgi:hypothetical protein
MEAPAEGFFWNLPEFGIRVLPGCIACPLEARFQIREQPEVTGSGIRRARWLGDDARGDVWLGALS